MADQPARRRPPPLTWLLVLLGIAAVVVAVVYFVSTADALPAFFPGHQTGSAHHHTTHGIAALVLGLVILLGAWITSENRRSDEPAT